MQACRMLYEWSEIPAETGSHGLGVVITMLKVKPMERCCQLGIKSQPPRLWWAIGIAKPPLGWHARFGG